MTYIVTDKTQVRYLKNYYRNNLLGWIGASRPSEFPITHRELLDVRVKSKTTDYPHFCEVCPVGDGESLTLRGEQSFLIWDGFNAPDSFTEPRRIRYPVPDYAAYGIIDLFRDDMPFLSTRNSLSFEWFDNKWNPHRDSGLPCHVSMSDMMRAKWCVDGMLHKSDGPAEMAYYDTGKRPWWTLVYAFGGKTMSREDFIRQYEMIHCQEYKGL